MWSLDTGLPAWENNFTWDTYACGHYIVVIHHKNDDKTDLMGFHIEGNEVFSPDAFVEGEDDQGCGGDCGDGSGIEGDVLEGLEVLDQGVGPLGGSPH